MSDLNRRLKKVEKALNVDKEQRVVEIVMFCDGSLPPDQTHGNLTIRTVRIRREYNDRRKTETEPPATQGDSISFEQFNLY